MSYVTNYKGISRSNFLESEIGLVTKTYQIPESMGVADGTRKIVPAGTPFPSNDASAVGIVFTDTDVTDGPRAGSVMVAGRVLKERLTVDAAAVTAMTDIKFVAAPDVVR